MCIWPVKDEVAVLSCECVAQRSRICKLVYSSVSLHNFLIDERETFDDEFLDRFLAEIRNDADPHVHQAGGDLVANQDVRDFLSYYMLQVDE
jgi:hypothetical protein